MENEETKEPIDVEAVPVEEEVKADEVHDTPTQQEIPFPTEDAHPEEVPTVDPLMGEHVESNVNPDGTEIA